jgi:hypothetical protein
MDNNKNNLNTLKQESEKLRGQIKSQAIGYIMAAFGLVAGLAWNEAIKSVIEYLFPITQNTLLAKFVYAVLMTVIVVIVTIYLSQILRDGDKAEKDK